MTDVAEPGSSAEKLQQKDPLLEKKPKSKVQQLRARYVALTRVIQFKKPQSSRTAKEENKLLEEEIDFKDALNDLIIGAHITQSNSAQPYEELFVSYSTQPSSCASLPSLDPKDGSGSAGSSDEAHVQIHRNSCSSANLCDYCFSSRSQ